MNCPQPSEQALNPTLADRCIFKNEQKALPTERNERSWTISRSITETDCNEGDIPILKTENMMFIFSFSKARNGQVIKLFKKGRWGLLLSSDWKNLSLGPDFNSYFWMTVMSWYTLHVRLDLASVQRIYILLWYSFSVSSKLNGRKREKVVRNGHQAQP